MHFVFRSCLHFKQRKTLLKRGKKTFRWAASFSEPDTENDKEDKFLIKEKWSSRWFVAKHEDEKKIEPDLPAIDDFLIEDTKFIANAVTVGSQTQWSHGVQEAGWKIKAEHEKKCEQLFLCKECII